MAGSLLMPHPALPDDLADPSVCLPQAQWEALAAAYAQPVRAYHDFTHVHEVLRHHTAVAAGPGWRQPRETWLAVLYHDAIYVPGRRDNEARSAELAAAHIARWLPDAGIDAGRVDALIRATARHGSLGPVDVEADPCGQDLAHFLDCDMAILGQDWPVFEAYDRAIAAEYAGVVPGWLFRFKRRRFLRGLADAPRVFLSDFFHHRLDAQARANLRRAAAGGRPRTPTDTTTHTGVPT